MPLFCAEKKMKHPHETDFKFQNKESGIEAIFHPTESHYSFSLLDQSDWAKHGKLSKDVKVRHAGPHGDTDQYNGAEVLEMAFKLAEQYV